MKENMNFKLDDWVKKILVDPLGKGDLIINDFNLSSSYGRNYPITRDGIYDLRLLNNEITSDQIKWKEGQVEFERREKLVNDNNKDYLTNILNIGKIYREFSIQGDCLDIGGYQGRFRHFLKPKYKYLICDPFLHTFDGMENQPNLLKAYSCLNEPVNFICCDAEFLPLQSKFFQIVHMQSCLDHFLSPELALNEAYRVLKNNGLLIIGTFIEGIKFSLIRTKRKILSSIGLKKYKDYHIWHPTFKELTNLIDLCNFKIEKIIWQSDNQSVCYIQARKKIGLTTKR